MSNKIFLVVNGRIRADLTCEDVEAIGILGPGGMVTKQVLGDHDELIIQVLGGRKHDFKAVDVEAPVGRAIEQDLGLRIVNPMFKYDRYRPMHIYVQYDAQGGDESFTNTLKLGSEGTENEYNEEHTFESTGSQELVITLTSGSNSIENRCFVNVPPSPGLPVDSWLPFGYNTGPFIEVVPGPPPPPPPPPQEEPNTTWGREEIISWLRERGVHITPEAAERFTKEELLVVVGNYISTNPATLVSSTN